MTLPEGTVTFLFTDVEASTRLLEQAPGRFRAELEASRRAIREACRLGHEVDTQGDAFFFAFARPDDAVAAALEAQRRLAPLQLRVRIGIHTGLVERSGNGYVGLEVNRAARIAAAAHGGQVLLSQATRDLLPDADTVDLGEHRLKDLSLPTRLYQAGHDLFPPPLTLENRPTNLPTQPWPLLGRDRELDALTTLLRDPVPPLLTVTGPAGAGKTRLALQAAACLVDEFPDGVWYVQLESLRDPARVAATVAATLGVGEAELDRHLDAHRLLLVLDNMEHLLDAGPAVVGLAAQHIAVLVTSRSPLRVTGEHEFPLAPLSVDPAVDLFVERARAVRPDFATTDGTLRELVTRLDGLPLAIELAAARVRLLSPETILARLDDRLSLLTGGPRDRPRRQQTLRNAIEWSYQLLAPPEQTLFRRLACFVGGLDLDAATRVCDATLDGLELLVASSLVRAEDERFTQLESIREYAAALLAESGEEEELRRRHAAYYLEEGTRARDDVHLGRNLQRCMEWGAREVGNLRRAVSTFREAGSVEDEARATLALVCYLQARSLLVEANEALSALEPRLEQVDPELRCFVELARMQVCWRTGDATSARAFAQHILEEGRRLRNAELETAGLNGLALAALRERDYDAAEEWFRRYEELARRVLPKYVPSAVNNLACIDLIRGRPAEARACLEKIPGDDLTMRLVARHNVALSYLLEGDEETAVGLLRAGIEDALAARQDGLVAYGLHALAAARADGDPALAARVRGGAVALSHRLGLVLEDPDARLDETTDTRLAERLGAAYVELLDEGSRLGPREVLDLALSA